MGGSHSTQSKDNLLSPSGTRDRIQSGTLPSLPPDAKCAIPVTFKWTEAGSEVFVVGSFGQWHTKILLTRQANRILSATMHLAPGEYQYKFIVDGNWKCASTQPIIRDKNGNENNWIKVEEEPSPVAPMAESSLYPPPSPTSTYTSVMPDPDDYLKDPPLLPAQIQVAPVAAIRPSFKDASLLHAPHQCQLQHVFMLDEEAPQSNVIGYASSCRHKTKFVTTLYYMPISDNSLSQTTNVTTA